MRTRNQAWMAIVLTVSLLGGCATAFRQPARVRVTSQPTEARVQVDRRDLGRTPLDVPVDRNRDAMVTILKENHEERHVPVRRRMNTGWLIWDVGTCVIPILLCVPLIVDAISGAWFDIDDKHVFVELQPAAAPAPEAPAQELPPQEQPPAEPIPPTAPPATIEPPQD